MNQQSLKGKWLELKGEIQKNWGKITSDELEQTKGNLKSIAGLLQQKYGLAQDQAKSKLEEVEGRLGHKLQDSWNQGKNAVVDQTEKLKEDLRDSMNP